MTASTRLDEVDEQAPAARLIASDIEKPPARYAPGGFFILPASTVIPDAQSAIRDPASPGHNMTAMVSDLGKRMREADANLEFEGSMQPAQPKNRSSESVLASDARLPDKVEKLQESKERLEQRI